MNNNRPYSLEVKPAFIMNRLTSAHLSWQLDDDRPGSKQARRRAA
jgi:hypothetical protein